MLNVKSEIEVGRLLAGAAKTVRSVRYCWLVTRAAGGEFHARPMGRLLADKDADDWIIRFVTDGRSRKAKQLRGEPEVGLIFQSDGDEAYAFLFGRATLIERSSDVARHWKKAYEAYFPTPADRAAAMFVEIEIGRMELWIRGVTPEPFGLHATRILRDAEGHWGLA